MHGKALGSSFWKFQPHQTSSVMLEASSTRCVDSRIKQRYSLSWILDRTCVKLCTTIKKQILRNSLSPCGRQGIDCHSSQVIIHTFCCTSGLHPRASIVVGVCEGYERVEAVSEGGPVGTTSNCLSLHFFLFLPLFVLWKSFRMLLHLISSSIAPNVPFYHSSCKC